MSRVYVGGTFDLFHAGHVNLLRRSAEYGLVWVALNSDDFCERYKRPAVMKLYERKVVVESCRYVERVVLHLTGEDSKPTIERVSPRYIAHGDDWTGREYMEQLGVTEKWLKDRNIELIYLPYTEGISTSGLIQRCSDLARQRAGVAEDPRKPPLPDPFV
jgi:glycerol-3-phosphate cytidylyltransferase